MALVGYVRRNGDGATVAMTPEIGLPAARGRSSATPKVVTTTSSHAQRGARQRTRLHLRAGVESQRPSRGVDE